MLVLRSRIGRLLVAGLLGGVLVSATDASVTVAGPRPFTRTVEPWIRGFPPSTPPLVDLTAACVRSVGRGQLEAVFGYTNPGSQSVLALLEPDTDIVDNNVIRRETRRSSDQRWTTTVEDLGPQVTLFLPGAHPHAFAVRFRDGDRVAWQVRVPSSDEPTIDGGWKVTVRPRLLSPCGPTVPKRFAVVQQARAFESPVNVVRGPASNITSWDVRIGIFRERVACSAGGVARSSRVTVGWIVPEPNLQPLPSGSFSLLELDSATYEMTSVRKRGVVDIFEPVGWLGPIADVYGRCKFGDDVVVSEVFWAGDPSTGTIKPIVEGGVVVELEITGVLPGGVRIR